MHQTDKSKTQNFLLNLFKRHASAEAVSWLFQKMGTVHHTEADKDLYLAFSAAPRFTGKQQLDLTETDLQEAFALRVGFNPSGWTTDQVARTLLLFSLPSSDPDTYVARIDRLFSTADMGELVALYANLPLLSHPEKFKLRAAEGVRTNIGSVFEAIAHNNPYPADYLDEGAWNQVVLKTLFVGKPLYRIYGLEKRSNPALARILSDYAHERWAAGRPVTPELWRPVGPFIDELIIKDIEKLFSQPDDLQQEAAALACAQTGFTPAQQLLDSHPDLKNKVATGQISWEYIGERSIDNR